MNPAKVRRDHLTRFTDLPNVGPAMARDFGRLGYRHPDELKGADPLLMYQAMCNLSGQRQDPCVLDTYISVTRFLAGDSPQPWWHYTAERKRAHPVL